MAYKDFQFLQLMVFIHNSPNKLCNTLNIKSKLRLGKLQPNSNLVNVLFNLVTAFSQKIKTY